MEQRSIFATRLFKRSRILPGVAITTCTEKDKYKYIAKQEDNYPVLLSIYFHKQ